MLELVLIVLIVCLTYCFKLLLEYNNPYVDELVEKLKLYDDEESHIGYHYIYKRKYKNGKVKFIKNISKL